MDDINLRLSNIEKQLDVMTTLLQSLTENQVPLWQFDNIVKMVVSIGNKINKIYALNTIPNYDKTQ